MTDIEELAQKKDGGSLKALAQEGNAEAAIAFADLVFEANYEGDTKVVKTKKEAKDIAREDAFTLLEQAAKAGSMPAMIRWANVNFHGVREPGNFGSRLKGSSYGLAETLYQEILAHPECPSDRRGELLARQAQSIAFKSHIKGLDRESEVLDLLYRALEESDSLTLTQYILTEFLWKNADYEEAVKQADACYKDYPFAALTLQNAYKLGLGVEQDLNKAGQYYQFWFAATTRKSKSK